MAFVPPYALLAGKYRWAPLASPQTMTPNPSRGMRTSLRPSVVVSVIDHSYGYVALSSGCDGVEHLLKMCDTQRRVQQFGDAIKAVGLFLGGVGC